MDLLLGGYGSSSDEEEEEQQQQQAVAFPEPTSTQQKRKNKKVLSLVNVLPQHILDQLTKSAVKGDDSDDDEESPTATSDDAEHKALNRTTHRGRDEGLSLLLSELHKTQTSNPSTESQQLLRPKETTPHVKEKLGDAFLKSTTVIEKKTNIAHDVHRVSSDQNAKRTKHSIPAPSKSQIAPPVKSTPATTSSTGSPLTPEPTVTFPTISDSQRTSRKRSRKEIERALRQGDFSALDQHDQVTSIEQAPPDQYVPQEETYAVPHHGIKVVPTQMYDPSQGTTVVNAGKGRGKNQINQLLASAASLELARARGLAGSQAGKTQRANAKRKYGW